MARRMGDNRAWAESLFIWGVVSLYRGEPTEAIPLLSRALAVYRFLEDEGGQWACLRAIALAWERAGDRAQALETLNQAQSLPHQARLTAQARWLRWFEDGQAGAD
ncbi:tetratricopeptide repeat protein [Meiothermus sp. QL-1]|nr:tetratricopeptide repeat protein [Meiothermus sp. QL-1]